jgi:hypothetical protein
MAECTFAVCTITLAMAYKWPMYPEKYYLERTKYTHLNEESIFLLLASEFVLDLRFVVLAEFYLPYGNPAANINKSRLVLFPK